MGVETPSKAYVSMVPAWDRIDTLLAGTDAMRLAGEKYLPRHVRETDESYSRRKKQAVLRNFLREALDHMVGRPFSRPIKLGEDVPEALKPLEENANLQGDNLHVFAKTVFRDAMAHGLSHILIDVPATEGVLSLAEERRRGHRPYFVHVKARNLIAAYTEIRDGHEIVTHARISETVSVREGFEEKQVEQVRVWEPGTVTTYRKDSNGKWHEFESYGVTDLGFVPLVTVYVEREAPMQAAQPLDTIAHLNIAHWQSASDQANILSVSRFPMLAAVGITEDELDGEVKVGPNQVLTATSADAKYFYVEHSGAAIEAGRQSLKDLEEAIAGAAVDIQRQRSTVTRTGTEIAAQDRKELSVLQAAALALQDALESAFLVAAAWLGLPTGGSVQVYTDFAAGLMSDTKLQAVQHARDRGDISQLTYLSELQRGGYLSEDVDVPTERERIEAEAGPFQFQDEGE